jgi:hypothetical protein
MEYRPVSNWDEDYVRSIAREPESLLLERKASAKLDPAPDWAELAKQICAFSNSTTGGFLVYGIDDDGNFDAGVSSVRGTTPIEDCVSQQIAQLLVPPVHRCEVKFLTFPSIHATGRGLLVIAIPKSDARPHWRRSPGEESYIRVDKHSLPMPRQTFLDIASRGESGSATIIGLGVQSGPVVADAGRLRFMFNPLVRLMSGTHCQHWALDFRMSKHSGKLGWNQRIPSNVTRHESEDDNLLSIVGAVPLLTGRATRAATISLSGTVNSPGDSVELTLFSGGEPVERTIHFNDSDA